MKDPAHNTPDDFDEYLRQSEPHRRERAESWKTAIGLQAEGHELKSSYLLVNASQEGLERSTNTAQVPHKYRTGTLNNPNLLLLIQTVGEASLFVTEMLAALHLQHRGNFLKTWLNPALLAGVLRPLYPDTPRHPRQKYQLTPRGREMYQQIKPTE